jgi:hypothetical protein
MKINRRKFLRQVSSLTAAAAVRGGYANHDMHTAGQSGVALLDTTRALIALCGRVARPPRVFVTASAGGMERTEEEYRALFEQSGFRLSKTTLTSSAGGVVEGTPSGLAARD